ncbi:Panacea domain-containing protein [Paraeggerthella hongkongensis]|nr:type II toxin-antitoxin system antitoxin SocA domain-containing protein [Paraeggerthella hongkongensis]
MSQYVCTASQLAHYVVDKCTKDGKPVSNLQLQKILYFLQAVYCKKTNSLLFKEEFEAWPYGPVMVGVYREYSSYGGCSIYRRHSDADMLDFGNLKSFIDDGIDFLREKYPWDLVKIAHAENSPWDRVYRGGSGYKEVIPNDFIIESNRK